MTERSVVDKRWRLPAFFMALGLVAAACGSDGDSATEAAAATQGTEAESTGEGVEDDAMEGDEAMEDDAEDAAMEDGGSVTVTIENIAQFPISDSGVFDVATGPARQGGSDDAGPALPGEAYEFTIHARPGQRLSLATMFVQTNDWFFAPDPGGIELFDADGAPISGDVTDQILTFDAGTEIDQTVGEGTDQAPRQSGADVGAGDPDDTVRPVDRDASDYVGVLITPGDDGRFDVRVENVSAMATVPSPIAPGVYAVHDPDVSLFEVGRADSGNGLEALAEDGDAAPLASFVSMSTGTTTPIAPGVYAVHDPDVSLFELGAPEPGLGLEALAEDGNAAELGAAIESADGVANGGVFNTPLDANEPGPVLPGDSYSFQVPAGGGRLSLATMFVQSNDWIFATPPEGLDRQGLDGDITDQLLVVDVGTEIDQVPGFGADQAPRQSGPDVGADDDDPDARLVADRDVTRYIKVTVTAS